eukprot:773459-Pleurochrysis_carterae.AAC.1
MSLLCWGRTAHGVLGTGDENEGEIPLHMLRSVTIPGGRPVVQVSCGELHSLALDASGDVYAWGSNLMGALGHGGRQDELRPRIVEFLPPALQINAGAHFSAALAVERDVFFFGWDGASE